MSDLDRLLSNPTARPEDLRAAAAAFLERADELEGRNTPTLNGILLLNVGDALLNNCVLRIWSSKKEETLGVWVEVSHPVPGFATTRRAPLETVVDVRPLWDA